jgi:DNA invertase Pin-like site-specific DNA recombinase
LSGNHRENHPPLDFMRKRHHENAVTGEIASDIEARHAGGESFRSIAKSVGVSIATVQNVLTSAAKAETAIHVMSCRNSLTIRVPWSDGRAVRLL